MLMTCMQAAYRGGSVRWRCTHLVHAQAADVLEQGGGATAGVAGASGQQSSVQGPQQALQGFGCIAQLPDGKHLSRAGAPCQGSAQLCSSGCPLLLLLTLLLLLCTWELTINRLAGNLLPL